MKGLCLAYGLTEEQLQQIRELENTCSSFEPLNMKLNWDMLQTRSVDELNDFLYYDNGKLVGFLALYGFGPKPREIEITGMVDPGYRRRGLFSELFVQAKQECLRRESGRILWVCERESKSGIGFVIQTGATYDFSEYRLRFQGQEIPDYPRHGLEFRPAAESDYPALMHVDSRCFGNPIPAPGERFPVEMYEASYVALLGDTVIGKVRTIMENEDGGIYGFAVLPEFQRRGYGREILSRAMEVLLTEKKAKCIFLEVASKNDRALALYKSCGFKEVTIYDYYELALD